MSTGASQRNAWTRRDARVDTRASLPQLMVKIHLRVERSEALCHSVEMRDPEAVEAELVEISAIADDSTKLERIIAWCATHPDEVPFAIRHLMGRQSESSAESNAETNIDRD